MSIIRPDDLAIGQFCAVARLIDPPAPAWWSAAPPNVMHVVNCGPPDRAPIIGLPFEILAISLPFIHVRMHHTPGRPTTIMDVRTVELTRLAPEFIESVHQAILQQVQQQQQQQHRPPHPFGGGDFSTHP